MKSTAKAILSKHSHDNCLIEAPTGSYRLLQGSWLAAISLGNCCNSDLSA
jgi:hypothetical protein